MSSDTAAAFRGAFPAFGDVVAYPDGEIDFWLTLADKLHNASRWQDLLTMGRYLFTAHNLTLESTAKSAAQVGGNPGEVTGPVVSSSVDKVSYSRSLDSIMEPGAGHWNLSTYGLRYIQLRRLIGAGPVYVGAPSGAEQLSQAGWPGPYSTPNPSN